MEATDKSRRESLGGSDAAAVLGLNPYSSRFDAWWSKVGPDPDEDLHNQWIFWGHAKEPVIADWYAKRHGIRTLVESPKRMDKRPWQTGTPDRLIMFQEGLDEELGFYDDPVSRLRLLRRGLEIKTGLAKHKPKWHESGCVSVKDAKFAPAPEVRTFEDAKKMVPLNYYTQCVWYMDLMNFDQWDLCVLLDSSDYREYRIFRDDDFIQWAVEECGMFWDQYVVTKREPPLDHGQTVNKYLASKYSEKEDGILKVATPEENRKAAELKALGARMRELINISKHLRDTYKATEQELHDVEKELRFVKEDNDVLCAYFRDAIGPDKGIETEMGDITWTSGPNSSRTLRKKWKK